MTRPLFASLLFVSIAASACSSTNDPSGAASSGAPAPAPTTPAPDPTVTPDPPAPNALATAIDSLFGDAAAKDQFSGSLIVVDGGKEVLKKGYGNADRDNKRANASDTVFRIGSVSKQFAATAVLRLVADGKLALTDKLSKHFPDYPPENLVKDGVEVTLHHLLSHTSGLPDPRATASFKSAVWKRTIAPSEQVGWAKVLPLKATPGTAYEYVNYNFLLAAMIVEKVSGTSYETFVKTRFFEPLGMKDSGTSMPAALSGRAAVGYYESGGEMTALADDPSFKDKDVSFAFGSGQIFSTVEDLAKWDRALAGDKLLPAAQRDLLFTPNLDDYGYGWVIQKKSGVSYEWHNGAISPLGFSAFIVRVPSKDRFVAYLANMDIDKIEPFEAKVSALVVK